MNEQLAVNPTAPSTVVSPQELFNKVHIKVNFTFKGKVLIAYEKLKCIFKSDGGRERKNSLNVNSSRGDMAVYGLFLHFGDKPIIKNNKY